MSVVINETNFPHVYFRNYVATYLDLDGDGVLSDDEISAVVSLEDLTSNASTLGTVGKELEIFTNLETFTGYVYTDIDFSAFNKLRLLNIQYKSSVPSENDIFDFRDCQSLDEVTIDASYLYGVYVGPNVTNFSYRSREGINNYYTSFTLFVDFSECSKIRTVGIGSVPPRSNDSVGYHSLIGLINKASLTSITLDSCMSFDSFDFSNNPALEQLICKNCPTLRTLNISGCTRLKHLECVDCDLRPSLDLTWLPTLEYLDVHGTNLSSLSLGSKPLLSKLCCYTDPDKIPLSSLDLNESHLLNEKFISKKTWKLYDHDTSYHNCYSDSSRDDNLSCDLFYSDLVFDARTAYPIIDIYAGEGQAIPFKQADASHWVCNGASWLTPPIQATIDDDGNVYRGYYEGKYTLDYRLHIIPAPVIEQQPSTIVTGDGQNVNFAISAYDPSNYELEYQWELSKDNGITWTTVETANTNSYTVTATYAKNHDRYRCIISQITPNGTLTFTSDAAELIVVEAPAIIDSPLSIAAATGTNASFTVTATSSYLVYQWQVSDDNGNNWTDIVEATTDTYSFSTSKSNSGNQYRCVVTNGAGTVTSNAATLTVQDLPVITSGLSECVVALGDPGEFVIFASGDDLRYQWQVKSSSSDTWTNIGEASSFQSYYFSPAASDNHNLYRCIVSNLVGTVTSGSAELIVVEKPVIITQPMSIIAATEATVQFEISVQGERVSYAWQSSSDGVTWYDAVLLDEETNPFWSLTAYKHYSGDQFRCIVTNIAGTVISDTVTLTVQDPVVIMTNLSIADYVANESEVTLSVSTTGDSVHYKWQESANGIAWTDINNTDHDSYTFTALSAIAEHQYRCYAYNDVSSTTSDAVTVHVVYEPGLRSFSEDDATATINPLFAKLRAGVMTSFAVDAYGGGLSYKWESKSNNDSPWTRIPDVTANPYVFIASKSDSDKQYRCIVTNVAGSVVSREASLTVMNPVQVVEHPQLNDYVPDGSEVTLSVTVSGDDPVYQWQESRDGISWTNLSGENGLSYTFTASSEISEYHYRCYIRNDVSEAVSSDVIVLISYPPTVIVSPSNAKVRDGANVSFIVSASGGGLRYQWQRSIDNGSHWTPIADATFPTYSFTASRSDSRAQYRCAITNSYATVVSESAILTVVEPAVIVTQPELPEYVVINSEVTIFVAATGDGLSYQWQQSSNGTSWVAIDGAESYQYTFLISSEIAEHRYRCYVENDVSNATSAHVTVHIAYNPVITSDLEPVTVSSGNIVRYRVSASGGGLRYQWQYSTNNGSNWTNIPEAHEDSYSFKVLKEYSGRQYRCQVTNVVNTVESKASTLSVYDPVVINEQPTLPEFVADGVDVTLSVSVSGDNPQYQWKHLLIGETVWGDISGENGPSYHFTAAKGLAGTKFQCHIQNIVSRETTNSVTLNIRFKPEIVRITGSENAVQTGSAVVFSCIAVGGDLTYQWQNRVDESEEWSNVLDGGTADVYRFIASSSQSGYQYRCQVTNNLGTTDSEPITLFVKAPPVITGDPVNVEASVGESVSFHVNATGSDLAYKWQVRSGNGTGWIDLTEETLPTYTFVASIEKSDNQYRCQVDNDVGFVVSRAATLTILTYPAVIDQPKSTEVEYGSSIVFSVSATGGNLTYQWQYRTSESASWINVPKNGNLNIYSFIAVDTYNGYQYRCLVHNSLGDVSSDAASLTVIGGAYDTPQEVEQIYDGRYLPSQMAAMIRSLPIGVNLDTVAFGAMTSSYIDSVLTNPGSTNPQHYEQIAEAINELKAMIKVLRDNAGD